MQAKISQRILLFFCSQVKPFNRPTSLVLLIGQTVSWHKISFAIA
ncbi:hypothetical protein A6A12_1859 [Vibrio anguillarum]|nr:hypothetical protein A6A12_1859 [Vibrio anguillarum]